MRSTRLRYAFMVGLGLLTILSLAAPGMAETTDDVVIGVPLETSGLLAYFGKQQLLATQMAVEDINAAGGIKGRKLRIIHYDTATKPQEAITAVRKLIERDKVLAIAGPLFSSSTRVAFPVANRAGVPIVSSASSAPGIAAANRPWSFRNVVLEADVAKPALTYWVKKNNLKNITIIVDTKDFVSKSYAEQVLPPLLNELSVKVADSVSIQTGDVSFSAQVTRMKGHNPDGVVLATQEAEAAGIAREVRRQGMKQPFFGGAPLNGPQFTSVGGEAVEGTIVASGFWANSPDAKIAAWVKRFKERDPLHEIPNGVAVYQYETMLIFKHCIESTGATLKPEDIQADREKIRDCWANLKDFPVVSGKVTINTEGDGKRKPLILVVQKGTFELVGQ